MSERTLQQRIMTAADLFAHQFGSSLWTEADADATRATLAALVAEACAPPPERVCRWVRHRHDSIWLTQGCSGHYIRWPEDLPNFCPDCGGRVEEAKEPTP